jgi:hypothetical protein
MTVSYLHTVGAKLNRFIRTLSDSLVVSGMVDGEATFSVVCNQRHIAADLFFRQI